MPDGQLLVGLRPSPFVAASGSSESVSARPGADLREISSWASGAEAKQTFETRGHRRAVCLLTPPPTAGTITEPRVDEHERHGYNRAFFIFSRPLRAGK